MYLFTFLGDTTMPRISTPPASSSMPLKVLHCLQRNFRYLNARGKTDYSSRHSVLPRFVKSIYIEKYCRFLYFEVQMNIQVLWYRMFFLQNVVFFHRYLFAFFRFRIAGLLYEGRMLLQCEVVYSTYTKITYCYLLQNGQ